MDSRTAPNGQLIFSPDTGDESELLIDARDHPRPPDRKRRKEQIPEVERHAEDQKRANPLLSRSLISTLFFKSSFKIPVDMVRIASHQVDQSNGSYNSVHYTDLTNNQKLTFAGITLCDHPSDSSDGSSSRLLHDSVGKKSLIILSLVLFFSSTLLFGTMILLSTVTDTNMKPRPQIGVPLRRYISPQKSLDNWVVASSKCHIPRINPWHESISAYTKISPDLDCPKILSDDKLLVPSLTFVRNNRLHLTNQGMSLGLRPEQCCFYSITRKSDDRSLEPSPVCHAFPVLEGFESPFDLIKITCPQLKYENIHSFIKIDPDEKEAYRRVAERRLNQEQHYNVVIVGIDTISRLNGYRQLNKTLSLLRDAYNTIDFNGYNKVGENTFPNLVPLLTGLRPEELTKSGCWAASNYTQDSESGDGYLDDCKYLWNFYQEFGYTTYFSEDWPKASTFNYLKDGFRSQPTTFYGRPFTIARDDLVLPRVGMGCASCLLDRPLVEIDLENLRTFLEENKDSPYFAFHWVNCPQHDDLNGASQVDSIFESFFSSIKHLTVNQRTFVVLLSDHGYRWNDFVSTRVGHYESSLPLLTIATPKRFIEEHGDLYENLKSMKNVLLTPFDLFKTMIDIRNLGQKSEPVQTNLIADPNARSNVNIQSLSGVSSSEMQGSIVAATTDSTLATNNLDTELNNHTVGTSTQDTYQVIKPVDGLSYEHEFKQLSLLRSYNYSELSRTCIEAGIPDNYCVCHEFQPMDISSNEIVGAALYLVHVHLYKTLIQYKSLCHPLRLGKIVRAEYFDFRARKLTLHKHSKISKRASSEENTISIGKGWTTLKPSVSIARTDLSMEAGSGLPNREYNIEFSTLPGEALFQEVVRYYGSSIGRCGKKVEEVKGKLREETSAEEAHRLVESMNRVCQFSVHSDSISRLNLYKNQSKCVKSNIELKKICLCRNL